MPVAHCHQSLPPPPSRVRQVQLSRAGLASTLVPTSPPGGAGTRAAPPIRALMLQVGETLSVWSRPAAAAAAAAAGGTEAEMALSDKAGMGGFFPPEVVSKESLCAGEEAFALVGANVGLLRALLAKEGWSAPLADCIREVKWEASGLYILYLVFNRCCGLFGCFSVKIPRQPNGRRTVGMPAFRRC